MRSFSYLLISLWKRILGRGRNCPSCGALNAGVPIDRKWIVTSVERCCKCHLLYRVPTTTELENERIYQAEYTEGFTTDLPGLATLEKLKSTNFKNSEKDYSGYVDVLRSLNIEIGAALYDFGCSWGYGSYQLAATGFNVHGYEISRPRARFASENLGVKLRNPWEISSNSMDVFFSAHVIEHVPSVQAMLELADRILRPGGWFVAFTPNGCLERRRVDPAGWHHNWGFVHPQLLDQKWIAHARPKASRVVVDTTPYDLDAIRNGKMVSNWEGSELLFAYQKGKQ